VSTKIPVLDVTNPNLGTTKGPDGTVTGRDPATLPKGPKDLGTFEHYDVNFGFECDWQRAINFEPGCTGTFGYLLFWSGCGGALKPDLTLVNPFTSTGQSPEACSPEEGGEEGATVIKCVGVIEKFQFGGDPDDPIRISAYLSKQNASSLYGKLLGKEKLKTDLEVCWYIISCEGAGEKWYEAAYPAGFVHAMANIATDQSAGKGGGTLATDLIKGGGKLKINVKHEGTGLKGEDGEIDIRLYRFEFEMVPAAGELVDLNFALGFGANVVKGWGGTR
jgi:hypothetical protein